jgi:hypothetical protein
VTSTVTQLLGASRSDEETMSEQEMSIEGKTPVSRAMAERDLFLELWAAEMLLRQRLAATAREFASHFRQLGRSEAFAANARFAAMLAAVFVLVSVMIALLEQIMPAWRAALVTSAAMASLGLALLQERWVAGAALTLRNARAGIPRRQLARIRINTR